jgi:carbamoyltransferase
MRILGVSCYYHDAAAALVQDGLLVAAAEEERFTRKKHDAGFPKQAIDFCLARAGITAAELDYVVFYEKPLLKFERILLTSLATWPRSWGVFRESMVAWFNEKLWVKSQLAHHLGLPTDKVLFSGHHLSHAASAFLCSPFEEAAILTCDGVGEWATTTVGRGRADWGAGGGTSIDILDEIRFPHSLGLLYSAFTAWLGFKVNSGEYKVMGMAPYGQPRYADKVWQLLETDGDGGFRLKMEYFCFPYSTSQTYNQKFVDLMGSPRVHESDFFTLATHPERAGAKATENQFYADMAASIQLVTEEVMLGMARYAHKRTGLSKLCLAGGVALNSVANGRIVRETPFDDVYIQPAAGDAGGALGAALWATHVLFKQPRKFVMEHAFWGADYSAGEVAAVLDGYGVAYRDYGDMEAVVARVVEQLLAGKVVGWHQGRFEWGPRALGNRSIIADPRRAEMKDIVNTKIKFREPFRPFAPVVLEERTQEFFDLPNAATLYPARYMLLVAPIHEDKQPDIPAVTHVNGTGRLQTVKRATNPAYYRVIEQFGQATGVPVLLNTSFNLRGEPLVDTPANALATFAHSDIDTLVLGNLVVEKDGSGAGAALGKVPAPVTAGD